MEFSELIATFNIAEKKEAIFPAALPYIVPQKLLYCHC